MFSNVSLFSQQFTINFQFKVTDVPFLSGGKDNIRRPELAGISPSSNIQTSFVECEICHVVLKSVRDLGIHKRENHPAVMKQKLCSGQLPSDQSTPLPVLHGNQKPAPSPVLLPRKIGCPKYQA